MTEPDRSPGSARKHFNGYQALEVFQQYFWGSLMHEFAFWDAPFKREYTGFFISFDQCWTTVTLKFVNHAAGLKNFEGVEIRSCWWDTEGKLKTNIFIKKNNLKLEWFCFTHPNEYNKAGLFQDSRFLVFRYLQSEYQEYFAEIGCDSPLWFEFVFMVMMFRHQLVVFGVRLTGQR